MRYPVAPVCKRIRIFTSDQQAAKRSQQQTETTVKISLFLFLTCTDLESEFCYEYYHIITVAEPPLGRARAAALGASRRDLEHTVNNKDSGEQEVGWI